MSAVANVLPFPPRNAAAALKARAAEERANEARRKVKIKIDRAAGVLDRLEARAKSFDLEIKRCRRAKRSSPNARTSSKEACSH